VTLQINKTSIIRLKKRSDFLKVASTGEHNVTPGLILQSRKHSLTERETNCIETLRLGFTVSKKVGNAVERNRAKRRLRAVAQTILSQKKALHVDLVIIGRQNTLKRPFVKLLEDFDNALKQIKSFKVEK